MNALLMNLTAHAEARTAQRGLSGSDLELIALIGTPVEGGLFVLEKQVQAFERDLKKLRDQARRLVGKRVVLDGDTIVTAYHARTGKERRLLRGAERRNLSSRTF